MRDNMGAESIAFNRELLKNQGKPGRNLNEGEPTSIQMDYDTNHH